MPENNDENLDLLVDFFAAIRPDYYGDYERAEQSMRQMLDMLKADPVALRKLRNIITHILSQVEILEIFTSSGVETEPNFFVELRRRLKHKILPSFRKEDSLLRVIDTIFYKNSDYLWVQKINKECWKEFFSLVNLRVNLSNEQLLLRLSLSMHIISCRIVTLVMNKEIRDWLTPEEIRFFISQNRFSQNIVDFRTHVPVVEEKYKYMREDLEQVLKSCKAVVARLRSQSVTSGTSLQQTYIIKQISQLIYRMSLILDLSDRKKATDLDQVVVLFWGVVYNENTKNSIRKLIRSNIRVLAYRIAEHEHDTGEHYIATDKKDFFTMLRSAVGGGIIAAFIALVKCFLHKISMAPFWQGFAYSLNYSAGFLAIHFTGSTLATKQPAMTASSIASAMDNKYGNRSDMSELAILISQVWRSQTASFIGNLGLAFPVALGISFLYFLIFKENIVEGIHAQELLDWQNPLKSNCLMYACNTGVFLYLSGLVTGFFDNKVIHGKIPERLIRHPFLSRFFPKRPVEKLARYLEVNLGPIVGNVFLGFCLGMAGFLGYIFGVDFDIRHITISTGQFAIGLQGLGYHVALSDLIMTVSGVLMIGFLNFLVSFTLAFLTASISRGIQLKQYRHLFTYLRRLMARYPLDFVFPPSSNRTSRDLRRK